MSEDKIRRAALMAAAWWAIRLDRQYADRAQAFTACLADKVESALRSGSRGVPDWYGSGRGVYLGCDYDPQWLLLDAVRETIDPQCLGYLFSANGLFPSKHHLRVTVDNLYPKAGYGDSNREPIPVPDMEQI